PFQTKQSGVQNRLKPEIKPHTCFKNQNSLSSVLPKKKPPLFVKEMASIILSEIQFLTYPK
ncbi:MAG: hypothetical protein LUD15_12735, partial [Bacteroides sp.]|nr:hypothetical protein [Bacteroides sp.]